MVFFGRIINDGDKNDPDANVKVMGRGRYIYILAGVFALYFMLLFAPQFRFDGLIYLETARSMVFDHDLNTYNEKHFFSDPGWNGLAGRLLFENRFRFIHFMQIPGYTEPGYQFTFFPFGNTIFWLPVMAAIKQLLMIFPVHSSAFINNGYSRVFQMGFAFWNILFVAAGLRIAYSVMIRFFPDRLAIVSLLIVLGSGNLLPFTFIDPTFSHGLDFFLINLLLFVLYKIQDNCGRQYDFIAGLLFGWLVTVRYQEVFLVLLPATIYIWKLIRKDTRVAAFKQSGLFAAGSLVK